MWIDLDFLNDAPSLLQNPKWKGSIPPTVGSKNPGEGGRGGGGGEKGEEWWLLEASGTSLKRMK